jgi:hypothetical protein
VRARIVNDIASYQHASGAQKAKVAIKHPERFASEIASLVFELTTDHPALSVCAGEYLNNFNDGVCDCSAAKTKGKTSRWFERIATLKKRQRVFGSLTELSL